MTHSKFRETVLNRSTVKLSELEEMNANTKTIGMSSGAGYEIDDSLVTKLREEYKKLEADIDSTVDNIYYQVGQNTFYVYLYDDLRVLMICYNNKAYTRYFLGKKTSRWKLVDGIERCICKSNLGLQDTSYKTLVKSLNVLALTFRLIRPEELAEKEESEKLITIDVSREGPTIYNSSKVSVKNVAVYENCNIFRYYSHIPAKEESLNISSLTTVTSQGKTKKFKEQLVDFKSANVYFVMNATKKPIILEIVLGDYTRKYYKDLDKVSELEIISESRDITSSNLAEKLIEESERINRTLIYQIDKTINDTKNSDNYGHGNSITVRKEPKKNSGFTSYTHTSGSSAKKSYILFQKKQLVGRSNTRPEVLKGVQDESYSYIKVYSFDNDRSFPLFVELNDSKTNSYYSHKNDESGSYWKKESSGLDEVDAKLKLDALYYNLKASVIIEIDRGLTTTRTNNLTYPIKLIDNKIKAPGKSIESYNSRNELSSKKNITVSGYSKISETKAKQYSGFYYVKHEIKGSDLTTDDKKDIGGFRLFFSQIVFGGPLELKLYKRNTHGILQESDRVYLYYTFRTGQESIFYVYYYGEYAIPLSVCYNSKVYKRRDDKGTEWVCAKEASCFDTSNILNLIKNVYQGMRKKFILVNSGREENIKTSTQKFGKSVGTFVRFTYEPNKQKSPSGPYKLPISTLIKGIADNTVLNKLLDTLNDQRFDKVTKYTNGSKPLLFEFVSDATKITFVRKDELKYWLSETIQNPETQIESIDSNVKETNVYVVDDTTTKFNDNITSVLKKNQPTTGFNKYLHTPQQKTLKKSLFLYNGAKLMKKGDKGSLEELNEINETSYDTVTVYFGTKAKSGNNFHPLILELNKSAHNPKTHYRLRLKDSSYYWENLTIRSQDPGNKQLINRLKETELDLVESLVILMDRRMPTYGNNQIVKAVTGLSPFKEIKSAPTGADIRVNNVTETEAKCFRDNGYMLYEHNITSSLEEGKNYALRFFIFAEDSSETYKEINLYSSDEDLDTLYFDTRGGDEKRKVYVYFYCEDPRPLLVCYSGSAFMPKGSDSYFEKWFKADKIKRCQCQADHDDPILISTLSEVVKFLNVVQLHKRPAIRFQEKEKPNTLDGPDRNGLEYKSPEPLSSVSVYYNLYDTGHKYPFLVVLKFKNGKNTEDFYKLKGKDAKEWEKMDEDSDKDILTKLRKDDTFENGLYDLRKNLEINFDKDNITPLFKADECTEDNVDWVAIGAGGGGGLVGVGTIVTISVFVSKKLAVTAATTVAAAAAAAAA
ncbi:4-methyl-5(b-hydroxyethyl)-thiazol monophosphate biosynthesis enzyme [Theileria orientalis]|uniref:4-methyl-5(B-hydroxyethyl)-thiazol monophosphate biosynthesis enzyme n=1 Tax=Theileria orientalis TaxID=68886 RepID=A0A976QT27_THEOR|nr:4-methyl-5(b-hydroxyethyl)-thiazol monophosphate biosynthesis enzyme [Theileria orientalis]